MDELIRRALMGDKQAQEECTKKGIALPCPFCKGEAIVEYDAIAPFEYDVVCGDCGVRRGISEDKKIALKEWNTRPAPPVGKCKDCKYYTAMSHCMVHSLGPDQYDPEDFCSYFKLKEESPCPPKSK